MAIEHEPKDFHDRAAKSSSEARGRAMTLSAGGIAGLFALLARDGFTADTVEKCLLVFSICLLACLQVQLDSECSIRTRMHSGATIGLNS